MDINASITTLGRVGKTTAARLRLLGLRTVEDLLFYWPFRYEDRSEIKKIQDLQNFQSATIKAKITMIATRRSWRAHKFVTEALVDDDTGTIKIVWFNQPFLSKTLAVGDNVYLSGIFDETKMQMTGPDYEKVKTQTMHTARIVPIYHLTAGLSEKQLRFLIKTVLDNLKNLPEFLAEEILKRNDFVDFFQALSEIHFPTNFFELKKAKRRLTFDKLFLRQILIQQARFQTQNSVSRKINFLEKLTRDYVSSLPFQLTDEQKKCAWEILQDLNKDRPMNRLLNGDVGSGKTVVMSVAAFNVMGNGYKVAILAPTEILAEQHFQTLRKFFRDKKFTIALFSRSQKLIDDKKVGQSELIKKLSEGQIDLLVGTHAILNEKIKIKDLGLVVVDEQHRFGVNQRKNLTLRGETDFAPHFLSMTATPIPRTLALTAYGDLDLSLLKTKPKNRLPIKTKFVEENGRQQVYDFIKEQIFAGWQVFVICPLIDPSDTLGVKSVKQEFEKLDKQIFPDLPIGLLHGRLKAEEKNQVMRDFLNKKVKILISTSVIEVGIDVPNATIMMIEGADRFGLAQLHQFRGRVGRGDQQAYCFVLSNNNSLETRQRLKILETHGDGFSLAEIDLQKRGAGEIYGDRQSGFEDLLIEDLQDASLIELAQKEARAFWQAGEFNQEIKRRLNKLTLVDHFE